MRRLLSAVHPFHSPAPRLAAKRRGAALVIVLAFVVLLTGLIIAFFSRSITVCQVSSSSASETKVDLFTQGALNTILGDLKQEITDTTRNSKITAVTGGTIYTPKQFCAAPALTFSGSFTAVSSTTYLQNLVKFSANGTPFYPGGPNRASNALTTVSSLNGCSITLARWNKPLLVAANGSPANAPTTPRNNVPFPTPNWILVARDGSTPPATALSSNMCSSATNSTTVVGRYAYMIYNEGGLLDVNVAGCPSSSASYQLPAGATTAPAPNYKVNAAYADLTVLDTNNFKPAQIDQLVAWRNYTSIQPTGSLSGSYTIPAASGSNYHQFLLSNITGFLSASGTMYNNQSDRRFVGRQELLDFMKNVLGLSITLPDYQYLGTFSRDLDQPSYAPDPSRPKTPANPVAYPAYKGNNDANGNDNAINPSFLTIRCANSFTRANGTKAQTGEPLVKYRFPLKRLALITYAGPITLDGVNYNPGLAASYINDLKQNYGFTDDFLMKGTPQKVYDCFGIFWDANHMDLANNSLTPCWVYNHTSNTLPASLTSTTGADINILSNVASLTREPDFVELLKAAICVGSIGKGAGTATVQSGVSPPEGAQTEAYSPGAGYWQNTIDTIADYHIIQICANIIDQFDLDSYPTHIIYNKNPSADNSRDFYGIENLPYFMGTYNMALITKLPTLAGTSTLTANTSWEPIPATYGTNYASFITDSGTAVKLLQPIIWNPHDTGSTMGSPIPTSFRFTAETANPPVGTQTIQRAPLCAQPKTSVSNLANTEYYVWNNLGSERSIGHAVYLMPNAAYSTNVPSGAPISGITVNSALTFTANPGMFSNPTVLAVPNVPAGSSLKCGPLNDPTKVFGIANGWMDARTNLSNKTYVGVFTGFIPMAWIDKAQNCGTLVYKVYNPDGTTLSQTNPALNSGTGWVVYPSDIEGESRTDITFRLEYEYPTNSGKWFAYDCKFLHDMCMFSFLGKGTNYLSNPPASSDDIFTWEHAPWYTCIMDPRTARFSSSYGVMPQTAGQFLVNSSSNVVTSARQSGTLGGGASDLAITFSSGPGSATISSVVMVNNRPQNVYSSASTGFNIMATSSGLPNRFAPGLFQQNNPAADNSSAYKDNTTNAQYFIDPDGVIRRGVGAWVPPGTGLPANTDIGLPMSTANQQGSRPVILNRPFRSVAELGYTFSGTPWRNLDFSTPESGFAALLDVFCINENTRDDALVAGKIDLNTRQTPVLKAVLAKAYRDEFGSLTAASTTEATNIATALVNRTMGTGTATLNTNGSRGAGPQQLTNIADLVGKYVASNAVNAAIGTGTDGSKSYDGFSYELGALYTGGATSNAAICQRFREAAIRGLSQAGTTRTWSLMIDLVAQTGRYPSTAAGLDNFVVEGEQRYWVHVAIDRYTGQILDMNIEPVKE